MNLCNKSRSLLASFLILTPIQSVAGNQPPKEYRRISNVEKVPMLLGQEEGGLAGVIKARNNIWKNTKCSKEQRHMEILTVYEANKFLMDSADKYIYLLADTKHLAPVNDKFIDTHIDEFFDKNPDIGEVIKLDSISSSLKTSFAVKQHGLRLIKTSSDFLKLIELPAQANASWKGIAREFVLNNLLLFKEKNPSLADIIALQNYLLKIQLDVPNTVEAIINMKEAFIGKFSGDCLVILLAYGCENPAQKYQHQLNKLLLKYLEEILPKITSISQARELQKIANGQTRIKIKSAMLNRVEKPNDFIELVQTNPNLPPIDTNEEITIAEFINKNIETFRKTRPSIEDVIALQNYILAIQKDLLTTVAALIKLKAAFIKDFSGADLIRLLAYGCDPAQEYINQLASLKSMYDITF